MTKVLLVEDDNNLREIYEARLAAEGYEISTAKDGEDALAVAKQVKPDLIISDVMMPRISGFEMLDILRNTDGLKHTRIIMLTALGQAEDKTRADSLGADRYLVKSQVTLEDIVKAAQELLNPENAPEETPQAAVEVSPEANNFSPTAPPDIAAVAHQSQAEAAQTSPLAPTLGSIESSGDMIAPPAPAPAPVAPIAPTVPVQEQNVVAPVAQPIAPPPAPSTENSDVPLIQMPPQPDEINAATVATSDAALSASQENTAVAEQIQDFVNTQLPDATPEAQPATSIPAPAMPTDTTPAQPIVTPVVPAPQDATANPVATDASAQPSIAPVQPAPTAVPSPADNTVNDQALQDAVNDLTAVTDDSTQPSATQSSGGGKKVIQPISDPGAETNQLETLLAQEEMQSNLEKGITGTPIIGNAAEPAQGQAPAQPQTIETSEIPVQPAPGGVFVPNTNGDADENAL